MSSREPPPGILLTNAKAVRSREKIEREKFVDRELRRLAKARRNRIKHHPCPTCETSGHIRRSFGFAYAGDPRSEAFAILVCPTCDGDGAQPLGRAPAKLHRGERAVTLAEAFPDLYPERVVSAYAEFDAEDLDLEAVAEQIGLDVDELLEAVSPEAEKLFLEGRPSSGPRPTGLLTSAGDARD